MIVLAVAMLLVALLAALPLTPATVTHLRASYGVFVVSVTGQILALPLALAASALGLLAGGAAAWVFAAAALLAGFVHWRNRRAGRVLLSATGLGDTQIPLPAGLMPFLTGGGKVRRIRNLAYGDHGERNLLDLVLPLDAPAAPMPILIHVHGGGWMMSGKDEQAKPLLNHLAAQGWLCADINYRLAPACRMPAMIVDVLKAIAWIKEHAPEYGGDPARVAITGGSAGGHLAVLAALAHDDPAFKPGFEAADCSVARAVPVYGVFDLLDRTNPHAKNHAATLEFMGRQVMAGAHDACPAVWQALSPIERVRADAPPMLVIHGSGDVLQPLRNARSFVAALRAVSRQPIKLVELPGIEHAYDMGATALVWAHVRAVEAFLSPLARAAESGTAGAAPARAA